MQSQKEILTRLAAAVIQHEDTPASLQKAVKFCTSIVEVIAGKACSTTGPSPPKHRAHHHARFVDRDHDDEQHCLNRILQAQSASLEAS